MNRQNPSASSISEPKSRFLLLVTGEIATAHMTAVDTLYCKYCYSFGHDWKQLCGVEEGVSATCSRTRSGQRVVLNVPLEATFSSTNPFKWPQLVLACYGPDALGNDVVRGYGSTHLPTVPGFTERKVPIFVPEASTTLHKILGFFTGRRAEFVDPRIVAGAEGRDVTKVSTQGIVTVKFNAIIKDIKKFGYDALPQTTGQPSDFPVTTSYQLHHRHNIESHNVINEEQSQSMSTPIEDNQPNDANNIDDDNQQMSPLDENTQ